MRSINIRPKGNPLHSEPPNRRVYKHQQMRVLCQRSSDYQCHIPSRGLSNNQDLMINIHPPSLWQISLVCPYDRDYALLN